MAQRGATPQTYKIHDHRGDKPSKTSTRPGTQVPPPRRQPPKRSGSGAMSFTEASQLFSRFKQLKIGRNPTYGTEPSEYVLPATKDTSRNVNSHNIKGTVNGKFLELRRYGGGSIFSGPYGDFHLSWSEKRTPDKARWFFHRKSSTSNAIRYGEPLSIELRFRIESNAWKGKDHNSYIRNNPSSGPVVRHGKKKSFEWALIGGKPGHPIRAGDVVVLYNLKRKQPLIYFRGQALDVGWPDRVGIKDSPQQVAKMRAAAKVLLMP